VGLHSLNGEGRGFYGILRDAEGHGYRATPQWSVSDSTVLAFGVTDCFSCSEERHIVAQRPGTAEVRVRFLNLSSTFKLTVVAGQ